MMPLYRKKPKSITKLAGTPVGSDSKTWASEVLKSLVSSHPYIEQEKLKIKFSNMDMDNGICSGQVIIDNRVSIPFSLRRDIRKDKWELDPIDILFDGDRFQHLSERSLSKAIDEKQVGQMVKKDRLPKDNRYIGDLTGDVTPLEWSGYPGYSAGPRSVSAGSGLLSYVVKNQQDVSRLFNMLNTYDGLNSAAEAVGLRDSLEALDKAELREELPARNRLAHVMRRKDGGFAVVFDNGDSRAVSIKDLKVHLGENFHPVMAHVFHRGWGMVRDYPVVRSSDVSRPMNIPAPIEIGGMYRVYPVGGNPVKAMVASEVLDFDGNIYRQQKAVCEGGSYALGKAIVGNAIIEEPYESTLDYEYEEPVFKSKGELCYCIPPGVIDTGKEGCFVNESFGSVQMTPNIRINKMVIMPDQPNMLVCTRMDTMEPIGIVLIEGIVRPHPVRHQHIDLSLMPTNSYYMPAHMKFVETGKRIQLMDKHLFVESFSDDRPTSILRKNAGRYYFFGDTVSGRVDFKNMTEDEMRTKLAWYSASDEVIETAMNMEDGKNIELYGLRPAEFKLKKEASKPLNIDYSHIKKAAEQAAEGMNEASEEAQDPKILDSILSLQFVSDETLEDLVQSGPIFEECEDKLARLLLAARQGEESIHERGVQKALRGIGEARNSLNELSIVLEKRNQ